MLEHGSSKDGEASKHPKMRYYTPSDVALHNCAEDCWLSLFGQVLDLTELILANRGPLANPLIAAAGTDVSRWFSMAPPAARDGREKVTGKVTAPDGREEDAQVWWEPRTYVDPQMELIVPYLPMGRFLHVPPNFPSTKWKTNFGLPWWRDQKHVIGKLTWKARSLRVVNILSRQEDQLLVACEDTIADIQERYLERNAHAGSYTWKVLLNERFVPAAMDKTLEENGIVDDGLELEELGLDDNGYTPVVHVYFNDDLTVA